MRIRNKKNNGFTLMELMVASLLSLLIVAGLMAAFHSHTSFYHSQEEISQTQYNLRVAMETIKDDLKRAGFMSTPDSNLDPRICQPRPNPVIQAIQLQHNNGYVPNNSLYNTIIQPDLLVLSGNYSDSEIFWAKTIKGNLVYLQYNAADPDDPFPPTQDSFGFTFNKNALLRIVNHGEKNATMFANIVSANFGQQLIQVVNNIPRIGQQGAGCGITGWGEGTEINVVNLIAYRVENPLNTLDGSSGLSPGEKVLKSNKIYSDRLNNTAVLVKYQLDPTQKNLTPLQNSREVVAENVIDFQVWFRFNNPNGPVADEPFIVTTENPQVAPFQGDPFAVSWTGSLPCGSNQLGSNSCPVNEIRSAIIKLAVRTSREDPNFIDPSFITGKNINPYMWFRPSSTSGSSARVRVLITEVLLNNIALNSF